MAEFITSHLYKIISSCGGLLPHYIIYTVAMTGEPTGYNLIDTHSRAGEVLTIVGSLRNNFGSEKTITEVYASISDKLLSQDSLSESWPIDNGIRVKLNITFKR